MSDHGERGRDGAVGAEGRAGTTGVAGPAGAAGASGARGATGAVGPRARYGMAGFLILMTFNFFGFLHVDREAERAIQADREGCERVNVLRINQAQVLRDQIAQSEIAIRGPLGSLESFRDEIRNSLVLRKRNLQRLRESVKDHPAKDRPYAIDCEDAFP